MDRVITYIDGFNLYYGISEAYKKKYLWLDLDTLSESLLKPEQKLAAVNYFTARINHPNQKGKRQRTYLEALETKKPRLKIHYGKYYLSAIECPLCHQTYQKPSEKMSDVNIATSMLADAFQDKYDIAILISGDSDLSSPIKKVKQFFPAKKVIIAFPPKRFSVELTKQAHAYFVIGKGRLANSQFPDPVINKNGFALSRPQTWK